MENEITTENGVALQDEVGKPIMRECRQVSVLGYMYVHKFTMDDNSVAEVQTTQADYEQLAGQTPQNPTIANGRWWYSGVDKIFGTPTGKLRDGEYAVENGVFCGIMSTGKYEETDTLVKFYERQTLTDNQNA